MSLHQIFSLAWGVICGWAIVDIVLYILKGDK